MNAGFCIVAASVHEKPKDPRFDEFACAWPNIVSVIEHRVCDEIGRERAGVRRGKCISRVALGCRVVPRCIVTLNFQPQTHQLQRKYSECTKNENYRAIRYGLETHGGGWGETKRDKCDKSGALQGGTMRVRASRSWARPAPRSEFFYLVGRAADRPFCGSSKLF